VHRDVDVIGDRIEIAVGGQDADIDCGMALAEGVDARHQPVGREGDGRGQRDRRFLGAGADPANAAPDLFEAAGHRLVQAHARSRGLEMALAAMEQPRAELLFQARDLTADRRLGNVEFLRRRRETAQPGDGLEGDKRVQRRQFALQ
jgi:hypothetical protein